MVNDLYFKGKNQHKITKMFPSQTNNNKNKREEIHINDIGQQ